MPITEINVAIIDDKIEHIRKIEKEVLSISDPKLNILFTATDPIAGIKETLEYKPDILFLDIEMPGKTGIEVLRQLSYESDFDCHVVFQTEYDKYVLDALREAAFDFIMKPVDYIDLCNVINRFKAQKYRSSFRTKLHNIQIHGNQRISLPTTDGLRFFQRDEIISLEYVAHEQGVKPYWAVNSYAQQKIMLRRKMKGQELLAQINSPDFFMINTGTIINLNHTSFVNYKTRECIMIPPFDKMKYTIARNRMAKFKERFDSINL